MAASEEYAQAAMAALDVSGFAGRSRAVGRSTPKI
jgi:hypothetical protein